MVINKYNTNYTETVKAVYRNLSQRYGYTARISDIWKLLSDSFNISQWELIDTRYYQNGTFLSYLIDRQIEWQSGKNVEFKDISDAILEVGDFTQTEKNMMACGDVEERLWAIFLCICDPTLTL